MGKHTKLLLLLGGVLALYLLFANLGSQSIPVPNIPVPQVTRSLNLPQQYPEETGGLLRPPSKTNFIFIGVDHNLLADAIMVGSFYRDTGAINLMSVPRDTYTTIPPHRREAMEALGLHPPHTLKINAMRAFGGRNNGTAFLKAQLEEMLGVHFHYYVEVDLKIFKNIVDAIGGITMYIPQDLQYNDPYQDLFINIPQGYQHLDGTMAEKVVRFRSFPTGDLMRNQMQLAFMKELIKQTLTPEAIMQNPVALARIVISEVKTNATLFELARYLPYLANINTESLATFTMPGGPEYKDGISWFILNQDKLPEVINQMFYITAD